VYNKFNLNNRFIEINDIFLLFIMAFLLSISSLGISKQNVFGVNIRIYSRIWKRYDEGGFVSGCNSVVNLFGTPVVNKHVQSKTKKSC